MDPDEAFCCAWLSLHIVIKQPVKIREGAHLPCAFSSRPSELATLHFFCNVDALADAIVCEVFVLLVDLEKEANESLRQ